MLAKARNRTPKVPCPFMKRLSTLYMVTEEVPVKGEMTLLGHELKLCVLFSCFFAE